MTHVVESRLLPTLLIPIPISILTLDSLVQGCRDDEHEGSIDGTHLFDGSHEFHGSPEPNTRHR